VKADFSLMLNESLTVDEHQLNLFNQMSREDLVAEVMRLRRKVAELKQRRREDERQHAVEIRARNDELIQVMKEWKTLLRNQMKFSKTMMQGFFGVTDKSLDNAKPSNTSYTQNFLSSLGQSIGNNNIETVGRDKNRSQIEVDRMADNSQTITGGSFNQCAIANKQTLDRCLNAIQQVENPELKVGLEKLHNDVTSMLANLDGKQDHRRAAQVRRNLASLIRAVSQPDPQRKWYTLSAKGLIEASRFVKDFTGNIAGAVGQIGKVLWPDFTLSEGAEA
jgi:hypothetical protein